VVDLDGYYSDSDKVFTRTYTSQDSEATMSTATLVTSGMAWTEDTSTLFDEQDLFKIYLDVGDVLTVEMNGNALGGGDLNIFGPDGLHIGGSANIGVTEHAHITALTAGYHYVQVDTTLQGTDWYTLWFYVT
jgi:hypothetical protein